MKIQGIDILLKTKTKKGEDPYGKELFDEKWIVVKNVLISPVRSEDVISSLDLYGKKAVYQLAIPKGDTNKWENTEIKVFNQKFKTFGFVTQGIEENIPLNWNKKIWVEKYE